MELCYVILDSDPAKDISIWENYSLDLTGLIKQQPGAIYRIELSFKKEYASYECETEEEAPAIRGATDLTKMLGEKWALSEDDEAYWDKADAYYYDGYDMYYDWNYYDSSEEGDPCSSSYYMQSGRRAITNVFASNIGMIAKSNSNNNVWVAVTNILDTKPF